MKLLVTLALALSVLLAPAANANPARDLTKTGIRGAVVLSGDRVYDSGNLRASDRFRVGSVTKTFVATVTLQLVAEGRLQLDQPVPEAGGAPLRTLLNHTSGVFNHAEDPTVYADGFLKRWKPSELIAISRAHPPYFAPGAGFHYSNTNYVIVGELIERTTGRSLERELERRIIRPLGLRDTSYDEGPRVRGVAPGYAEGKNFTVQNTSWAGASGSMVSTARDLARFYRALLRGKLLEPEQLAAMKTRDPVAGEYGLGLYTVKTPCGEPWGHNGMVPGYFAQAYASDDGKRRVAVFVNRQPLSERQEAAVNRAVVRAYCR
jgi:D-alanyl-D-alanine carboxypeptidase